MFGVVSKKVSETNWGLLKGKIEKQQDLIERVGTKDIDEGNIADQRILVYDAVTGKRVYIDLPNSAIWGAIEGDILDQEDLKLKLEAEKRIVTFDSNLDTTAIERFVGPINLISFDLFYELDSIALESTLDTDGNWAAHANLTALQAWVDANITVGTKWLLKVIATYKASETNASGTQLNYNSQDI